MTQDSSKVTALHPIRCSKGDMEMNDTARDALARWIASQLLQFSYSELKTIAVRVERLAAAVGDYGHLDLATDRRLWKLEGAYEGIDRQWYEDAEFVFNHDPAFADIREMRKRDRVRRFLDCDRDLAADFDSCPTTQYRVMDLGQQGAESAPAPCTDCDGTMQRHGAGCPYVVLVPGSEVVE